MTPRKTLEELIKMSGKDILAYLEQDEAFIENPTEEDFEGRDRVWKNICQALDLKQTL